MGPCSWMLRVYTQDGQLSEFAARSRRGKEHSSGGALSGSLSSPLLEPVHQTASIDQGSTDKAGKICPVVSRAKKGIVTSIACQDRDRR